MASCFALVAVDLAVGIGLGAKDSKQLGLAAGLALVAAVMVVLGPAAARESLKRVTKVSLPGFGIDMGAIDAGEEQEDTDSSADGDDLTGLRLSLDEKLSELGDKVLGRPLSVGGLRRSGHLTREQARLANEVQVAQAQGIAVLSQTEGKRFLSDAKGFVGSVRAIVFAAHVTQLLEEWGTRPRRAFSEGKKRDLKVVLGPGGSEQTVIPVYATKRDSPLLEKPGKRLGAGEKDVIVVPDHSSTDGVKAKVPVVKLGQLKEHLGV